MRKREGILPLTSFLFLLSLGIFLFSNSFVSTQLVNGVSFVTRPVSEAVFAAFSTLKPHNSQNDEVFQVAVGEVKSREVEREMQALRDQFQTSEPKASRLMPSQIVGYAGYVPGVHSPQSITLNKGTADGVSVGQAVIYQQNLIGKISKTSAYLSEVVLVTNSSLSFTAESLTNNAAGVVRGGREVILMDNIVLSEDIEVDELVVTKGDTQVNGSGFPPNLIVGKVVSKDTKQSNLFQTVQIQSLVDITSLQTVFILLQ